MLFVITIALERPFAFRICKIFRSEVGFATVIVYFPAGRRVSPTLKSNGMVAITFWALDVCAWAPAVRTPARMIIAIGMLRCLFMIGPPYFIGIFAFTY